MGFEEIRALYLTFLKFRFIRLSSLTKQHLLELSEGDVEVRPSIPELQCVEESSVLLHDALEDALLAAIAVSHQGVAGDVRRRLDVPGVVDKALQNDWDERGLKADECDDLNVAFI